MTFNEKLDRLDAVYAWDCGCVSSGIKDDDFKRSLRGDLDEAEKLLTFLAKKYLNEGHTFEDISCLVKWAEKEFDLCY